jgi:hypothetical protein
MEANFRKRGESIAVLLIDFGCERGGVPAPIA